ncbi:MAG: UGSC family (seleno)protein, partial [Betaproteobacteria bacterium]
AGKVVGFIDNSKPNFSLLADDLGELLMAKYGVAKIVRHRKPTASVSASPQVFADIKQQCDLVITGSGD